MGNATLQAEEKIAKKSQVKQKKIKDKSHKNTYIYGFIFIVFSLVLEMAGLLRLGLGAFPTNFGIELSIILMLAGLIFIVPTKIAKICLMTLFLGVQIALNIANASLFKVCNDLVTLDMVFTLGLETVDVFEFNQLDIPAIIICLVVVILYVLAIVYGAKYAPKFEVKKDVKSIVVLVLMLISVELIGFCSLNLFKWGYFSNSPSEERVLEDNGYWYTSMNNKFASLKKFGFWGFYINNAKIFFGYDKTLNQTELEGLKNYITAGENFVNQNSTYGTENVSGALAGDNLIMIMMESIEWFAIDPFNTPNLYNFIENDAVQFTNYYSRNKTNISEQISILGNVPNEYSIETVHNNVGLDTTFSLPNLFKDSNYESVNYFHDYSGKIYDRNILNKEMGFENVYAMEEYPLGFTPRYFGDFLDDGDYIKEMLDLFAPTDQSFFSFFTTVTTHGPYAKSNDRFTHYYDEFERNYQNYIPYAQSMGWATPEVGTYEYKLLKEYKSKAMAVEHAFVVIDDYLSNTYNEYGQLLKDNTTIVMFADHNAYYSDMTTLVKGINKYAQNKELYRVPLVVYNKDLAPGKVDTFCTTFDLYPTICDLYGLQYNQNVIHGHSIFSQEIENSVFVSTMSGLFDQNFYTTSFDKYYPATEEVGTEENLNNFKNKINNFCLKQDMIEKYYRINYHKTL